MQRDALEREIESWFEQDPSNASEYREVRSQGRYTGLGPPVRRSHKWHPAGASARPAHQAVRGNQDGEQDGPIACGEADQRDRAVRSAHHDLDWIDIEKQYSSWGHDMSEAAEPASAVDRLDNPSDWGSDLSQDLDGLFDDPWAGGPPDLEEVENNPLPDDQLEPGQVDDDEEQRVDEHNAAAPAAIEWPEDDTEVRLTVGGKPLHTCHSFGFHRGVHWCWKCAAIARVRPDKLAKPCLATHKPDRVDPAVSCLRRRELPACMRPYGWPQPEGALPHPTAAIQGPWGQ